MRIDNNFMIQ